jgi:trans-aconitate methyltransferase
MAAPIPSHIQRVLDFGTGTGIWAIDFADEYPSVQVVGNDLSAIQPRWVPPNLKFIIDDVEAEWVYGPDEAFDFIHGRAMAGSIRNWPKLYSEIYKQVRPGGWVEIQEYETFLRSDDDTIDHATAIKQWQDTIEEASAQFGKRLNVAAMQKQHMIDAGYVDVFDYIYKV